jgi:tetratricopeptide (TPR) repeat protein
LFELRLSGVEELIGRAFSFVRRFHHPTGATILVNLGYFFREKGLNEAAISVVQEALRVRRKALADGHPDIASALALLGGLELDVGRPERAQLCLRECVAIRRRALGAEHWLVADAESRLGECLCRLQDYDDAEALLVESYWILRASGDAPPKWVQTAWQRVVKLYEARGKPEQAAEWRAKLPTTRPTTQPATPPTDVSESVAP